MDKLLKADLVRVPTELVLLRSKQRMVNTVTPGEAPPVHRRRCVRMVSPRVEIHYCPRCRWLARASWLAQELLTTFEAELGEVALVPAASGTFDVWLNEELLFSRRTAGRFPEPKELKQAIRDRIDPARHLGHSDRR